MLGVVDLPQDRPKVLLLPLELEPPRPHPCGGWWVQELRPVGRLLVAQGGGAEGGQGGGVHGGVVVLGGWELRPPAPRPLVKVLAEPVSDVLAAVSGPPVLLEVAAARELVSTLGTRDRGPIRSQLTHTLEKKIVIFI